MHHISHTLEARLPLFRFPASDRRAHTTKIKHRRNNNPTNAHGSSGRCGHRLCHRGGRNAQGQCQSKGRRSVWSAGYAIRRWLGNWPKHSPNLAPPERANGFPRSFSVLGIINSLLAERGRTGFVSARQEKVITADGCEMGGDGWSSA